MKWFMDSLAQELPTSQQVKLYRQSYKLAVWVGALGWALFFVLILFRTGIL